MRATNSLTDERVPVPGTRLLLRRWSGTRRDEDAELVPRRNPNFVFHPDVVSQVQWALDSNDGRMHPILLLGDSGEGKTEFVRQIAAVMNAPLTEVCCHGDLRVHDLLGIRSLRSGGMTLEKGPVARAFEAGHFLNLDEVSLVSPQVLSALHDVLADATVLVLADGSRVRRGTGFAVFGTSNVMGSAATRRIRYAGNAAVSDATLSRFSVKVRLPALSEPQLVSVLLGTLDAPLTRRTRTTARGLARWFLSLQAESARDPAALPYRVSMRELLTIWSSWNTTIRTLDGEQHRSIVDAAAGVLQHAMRPEESGIVMNLLRARVVDATVASR